MYRTPGVAQTSLIGSLASQATHGNPVFSSSQVEKPDVPVIHIGHSNQPSDSPVISPGAEGSILPHSMPTVIYQGQAANDLPGGDSQFGTIPMDFNQPPESHLPDMPVNGAGDALGGMPSVDPSVEAGNLAMPDIQIQAPTELTGIEGSGSQFSGDGMQTPNAGFDGAPTDAGGFPDIGSSLPDISPHIGSMPDTGSMIAAHSFHGHNVVQASVIDPVALGHLLMSLPATAADTLSLVSTFLAAHNIWMPSAIMAGICVTSTTFNLFRLLRGELTLRMRCRKRR